MSATLAFSTVKPLSFSNENCLFSSTTTTSRSKSNHHHHHNQQQMSSFNHRTPNKPTVVAYAGSAGVMERRKSSSATTTLYEVLRVKQNASPMEIKTAYRTLAKVYHPDAASESDGRDFIEIHNAYSTLSDPSARALYDLSLAGLGGDLRPFSYTGGAASRYSSSSSSSSRGYTSTRRWETDQCW